MSVYGTVPVAIAHNALIEAQILDGKFVLFELFTARTLLLHNAFPHRAGLSPLQN
jgi:hypothetical protein